MKEIYCICGQLVASDTERNEHILSHFTEKHCVACDNQLIFVAGNWYQPHLDVNCIPIKQEPEEHFDIGSLSLDGVADIQIGSNTNIEIVELPIPKEEYLAEEFEQNEESVTELCLTYAEPLLAQPGNLHTCESCLRTYQLESSLIRHRKSCGHAMSSKLTEIEPILLEYGEPQSSQADSFQSYETSEEGQIKPFKCAVCSAEYTLRSSLNRHKRKMHRNEEPTECQPSSTVQCKTIQMGQMRSVESSGHQLPQTDRGAKVRLYGCPLCSIRFTRRNNATRHIREHHNNEKGPVKKKARTEMSTASADDQSILKPFRCSLCPCRYKNRQHARAHMRNVHQDNRSKHEKLFEISRNPLKRNESGRVLCPYCPATFARASGLAIHRRLKHRDRLIYSSIKCERCSVSFLNKKSLQDHMLRKHPNPNKIRFVCYLCHESFQYPKGLTKHMPTHPGVEYKCCYDECDEKFESDEILFRHLTDHLQVVCKICQKSYTQLSTVVHKCLTEKKLVCDYCGKIFPEKYSLKIHMNMHTDNRPYPCDTCGKAFRRPTALTRHRHTHTGTKPLVCNAPNCDRAFIQHTDLYRHQFKAHGIFKKKYPCTICDQVFPENALLRKHMLNHEV